MSNEAEKAGRSNYETTFLALLWDRRAGGLITDGTTAPREFRESLYESYSDTDAVDRRLRESFVELFNDFVARDYVRVEPLANGLRRVTIRPEGVRELGRRSPTSWADSASMRQIVLEQVADLLEIIDETQTAQSTLDRRIAAFEERLANTERSFYAQVVPLLAIFVAAFALILTGAQTVVHLTATDPWQILLRGAATMGPVTIAVLIFLIASRCISRWGSEGAPPNQARQPVKQHTGER